MSIGKAMGVDPLLGERQTWKSGLHQYNF